MKRCSRKKKDKWKYLLHFLLFVDSLLRLPPSFGFSAENQQKKCRRGRRVNERKRLKHYFTFIHGLLLFSLALARDEREREMKPRRKMKFSKN
jgi:hypothetical protein